MKTFPDNSSTAHAFHYLNWIVTARKAVMDYDVSNTSDFAEAVATVGANASRMLPGFEVADAPAFTREVMWHQLWSAEDQDHPDLLRSLRVDDPDDRIARAAQGTGTIFCTFHTGSYRLLPYLLGVSGVALSLIADAEFVATQGDAAIAGMAEAQRVLTGKEGAPLKLLVAEDPGMPLRAARLLRGGASVVLYLDGNTGVGGPLARNGNQVALRLCGEMLAARKGAAFLSHLAKAPIVPVISSRPDWLRREITVFDPLCPEEGQAREDYCEAATRRLFAFLEEHVRAYPSQWEAWLYVHKFFLESGADVDAGPLYRFNARRFGLGRQDQATLLVDKATMRGRPIDAVLEETLRAFMKPRPLMAFETGRQTVSPAALNELGEAGILVPEARAPA